MKNVEYFKPYEGNEPYIFISYAHRDSEKVMEIICDMHDRGFHIWYDEGIEVGSEWTECIASHLAGAALMLGFVTDSYMASDNCRREMNYAVQKKKKVINIFLEPTTLTPGMELQIGGIWALMKYTFPSEEYFYQKLYESPALQSENFGADANAIVVKTKAEERHEELEKRHEQKELTRQGKKALREELKAEEKAKKKPGRVKVEPEPVVVEADIKPADAKQKRKKLIIWGLALALVIAAVVLSVVGYRLGFFIRLYNNTLAKPAEVVTLASDTTAEFKNPVFEAAAREYCGKETGTVTVGDLAGLTTLIVCGEEYSFDPASELARNAAEMDVLQTDVDYAGGGAAYTRGGVMELSDVAYFPDLQSLTLAFQSLTSLESLPSTGLTTLKIRCNRLSSLNGVASAPLLEELNISGNRVTDISALAACIKLTELNMTGAAVKDFSALKGMTKLAHFSASGVTEPELRDVLLLNSLTSVRLVDCDLRGDFFDDLDSKKLMYLELEGCLVDSTLHIERLTGLTELHLTGCSGVSDWSALSNCPALRTVHADKAQQSFFPASHTYELVIKD